MSHTLSAEDKGRLALPVEKEPTGASVAPGPTKLLESTVRYLGIEVHGVLVLLKHTD